MRIRSFRPFASLLAPLGLALALPACAQPAPTAIEDADPALWVVKDDDTTIYLFGTIHVLKPGLTWFDEAVKTAFDASDTLVLEMVEPDAATQQQVVMGKAFTTSGPTLGEQLPAAKRAVVEKALAETGIPADAVQRMRPWFAAISLSIVPLRKLGYDAANGPEGILSSAAAQANKPVRGLETFEGQMSIFDTLSTPAQLQLLESTVDELPKAAKTMDKMVRDWAAGDPNALARDMNATLEDSPEVAKTLLTDRNAKWASWIAERMRTPGTVFMAVGAGHLAGKKSVQAQLRAYRLRAKRVSY